MVQEAFERKVKAVLCLEREAISQQRRFFLANGKKKRAPESSAFCVP
jgi:hypothetical protein